MDKNQLFWETTLVVRFPDCDPFNHLNNSRYLDYFINAREDHLRFFHHFDIYELARQQHLSWVVQKHEIVYLNPALLMETVVIQSAILRMEEREILVEMRMWNEGKTRLKAFLWTHFVHYDLKAHKAVVHDRALMDRFRPFVQHAINDATFEQRLEETRM